MRNARMHTVLVSATAAGCHAPSDDATVLHIGGMRELMRDGRTA